jgi:predicted ATPase/DNA-binding winged helix-turn-helix (wHTH) protein
VLSFGPFTLIPSKRLLLHSGRSVHLPSRAWEILLVLVEHPGTLVSKEELIARVWSGTVVSEGALRVHIAGLRKLLGDGRGKFRYVESISGQGYRFIAPVSHQEESAAAPEEPAAPLDPVILQPYIVGRDEALSRLVTSLPRKRFMTVTGAGGIGKTTLVMAAVNRLRSSFEEVGWVDLASIFDSRLVPVSIAANLGLSLISPDPLGQIVARLKSRRMLIVLDNCEHVVDCVVRVTEELLRLLPELHLLVTSREPLRAKGEWVMRLAPLSVPPPSATLTVAEALSFPAMNLFARRAAESQPGFRLQDADIGAVAHICRKLDGIPLAIELAAARVGSFGAQRLAADLDDCLKLAVRGRGAATARHQTLQATLDWSYRTLSHVEQLALRRLAVFAGNFNFESAVAVLAGDEIAADDVLDILTNLEAKSLIMATAGEPDGLLHLLQTSRSYALEKLESSAEGAAVRRRHAELCCGWGKLAPGWEPEQTPATVAATRRKVHDIRAALDWCFSAEGDPSLGVQLTAASAPFWFQMCWLEEYRGYLERATDLLQALPANDPEIDLQLYAALGEARIFTQGTSASVTAAFNRALHIAGHLGSSVRQRRAYWGLWMDRIIAGEYDAGVALAEEYRLIAESSADPADVLICDRMMTLAHHVAGNQAVARRHAERVLLESAIPTAPPGDRGWHFDHRVAAYAELSRILWIQGFPEQARRAGSQSLQRAMAIEHVQSLCRGLTAVCGTMIWLGEMGEAQRFAVMLLDYSGRHPLPYWSLWARILDAAVRLRDDEAAKQVRFELLHDPVFSNLFLDNMPVLNGRLITPHAIGRAENGLAGAYAPEILRVKAEHLLAADPSCTTHAQTVLLQSLSIAQGQGALSWELRTATSLAELWMKERRVQEAHAVLAPIYARFTEGLDTTDLQKARALLDHLAVAPSS